MVLLLLFTLRSFSTLFHALPVLRFRWSIGFAHQKLVGSITAGSGRRSTVPVSLVTLTRLLHGWVIVLGKAGLSFR